MKIDDILVCRWGTTMVLYDFYKVKGFSESGKTAFLKELSSIHLDGGTLWKDPVIPGDEEVGPVLLKRIKNDYIKISPVKFVKTDSIWDGQKIYYENHCD
jgi:hypothetical protein